MSSNTLSGAGVSPANTKAQLLHIGAGTLAAGAVVRLGDGTATPLTLSSAGMAVDGKIAATTMAVESLVIDGVPFVAPPAESEGSAGATVIKRLGTEVVAATTTYVPLTALNFTPVAGAVYLVELAIQIRSVATSTGFYFKNTSGDGSMGLAMSDGALQMDIGSEGNFSSISMPTAAPYGHQMIGCWSPATAAPLGFSIRSEVANSAITVFANSTIRFTRIS